LQAAMRALRPIRAGSSCVRSRCALAAREEIRFPDD
jgi:hypothetical protein